MTAFVQQGQSLFPAHAHFDLTATSPMIGVWSFSLSGSDLTSVGVVVWAWSREGSPTAINANNARSLSMRIIGGELENKFVEAGRSDECPNEESRGECGSR